MRRLFIILKRIWEIKPFFALIPIMLVMGAGIISFVLTSFLPVFFPAYREENQIWQGYYTILVKKDFAYRDLLVDAGWNSILSAETETVFFSTFDGLDRVSIDKLDERFDPRDPRLDDYAREINRFYVGEGDWMRIYIPSRLPAFRFFLKVLFVLPGYGKNWRMVDFAFYRKLLSLLLSVVFVMILIHIYKKNRLKWIALIGFLPWMFCLLSGDYHDLVSFYLLYSAWFLILEDSFDFLKQRFLFKWRESDKKKLLMKYIYLGLVFLLTSFNRISAGNFMINFFRNFIPVLANFLLVGACFLGSLYKYRRSEHLIFSPVSIIDKGRAAVVRKSCLVAVSVLVLVTPVLIQIGNPLQTVEIPVPRRMDNKPTISWDSIETLRDDRKAGDLPDISEFVVHRVYQEGLIYGQPYAFPEEGSSLNVSSFTLDDGNRINKTDGIVTKFDNEWLSGLLSGVPQGSLAKMLMDQKTPVGVSLHPWGTLNHGFIWWRTLILLLFIFFILFFFDIVWTPVLFYVNKNSVKKRYRRAA